MADKTVKEKSTFFRLCCFGTKEMVHSHATADVGVLIPLHSTLCEGALGFHDFLEQWIFRRLLGDNFGPDFQLVLQNRIRCFVELDLVFGLQLDVVLGVTVNGFP